MQILLSYQDYNRQREAAGTTALLSDNQLTESGRYSSEYRYIGTTVITGPLDRDKAERTCLNI